ncbi:hypothetical protein NIES4101_68350 [Calothrix sp. NIES-4101]|nr:hypothetical protein NIES4101_68350 [Calothrix sp. NIES-4101]
MASNKNFFSQLFDFSFSEFLALKIVGVLYGIGMFFAGIFTLGIAVNSFRVGFASGVVGLILAPIIFLLYILFIRIALEGMIVAFRTAENTARIAENTKHLRNP